MKKNYLLVNLLFLLFYTTIFSQSSDPYCQNTYQDIIDGEILFGLTSRHIDPTFPRQKIDFIHEFTSRTGPKNPENGLCVNYGHLIMSTKYGGANNHGMIYCIPLTNYNLTDSIEFALSNKSTCHFFATGSEIFGEIGKFVYGTTSDDPYDTLKHGELFKIALNEYGNLVGDIINISTFNDGNYNTGKTPELDGIKLYTASDNTLWIYGTTSKGGLYDKGTLYRKREDGTGVIEILHNFGDRNVFAGDGENPHGDLFFIDNIIYGTTTNGGSLHGGIVWKYIININNNYNQDEYNKITNLRGHPKAGFSFVRNDFLWGATMTDGIGYGRLFKIPITNSTTVVEPQYVYNFTYEQENTESELTQYKYKDYKIESDNNGNSIKVWYSYGYYENFILGCSRGSLTDENNDNGSLWIFNMNTNEMKIYQKFEYKYMKGLRNPTGSVHFIPLCEFEINSYNTYGSGFSLFGTCYNSQSGYGGFYSMRAPTIPKIKNFHLIKQGENSLLVSADFCSGWLDAIEGFVWCKDSYGMQPTVGGSGCTNYTRMKNNQEYLFNKQETYEYLINNLEKNTSYIIRAYSKNWMTNGAYRYSEPIRIHLGNQLLKSTADNSDNSIKSNFDLKIIPNPTSNSTKIFYNLPETISTTIIITDNLGNIITQILDNKLQSAGDHEIEFVPPANTPAGIYTCTLKTNNNSETIQFVIVR